MFRTKRTDRKATFSVEALDARISLSNFPLMPNPPMAAPPGPAATIYSGVGQSNYFITKAHGYPGPSNPPPAYSPAATVYNGASMGSYYFTK